MSERKVGRPSAMTEDILQKLEYAFSCGLTDTEACLYANIAPSTLYLYCSDNKDFSERKELLKQQPGMKAKLILNKHLDKEDKQTAQWYAERKLKNEFSLKQEIDNNIKGEVSIVTAINVITPEK